MCVARANAYRAENYHSLANLQRRPQRSTYGRLLKCREKCMYVWYILFSSSAAEENAIM